MSDVNAETQSLADLKEVIGRLWNKVDQLQIASDSTAQRIHEKLDVWINTNYILIESNQKLIDEILSQAQATQESMQSFEQGAELLKDLSKQIALIESATSELQATSTLPVLPSLNPERLPLKQVQTLYASINALKQTIESINPSVSQVQSSMTTLDNQLRKKIKNGNLSSTLSSVTLGTCIFLVGAVLLFAGDLRYLKSHVNDAAWQIKQVQKAISR